MPESPLRSNDDRPPRGFSLRLRLLILASLVLLIALGLVGIAVNAANYRSAVSSLEARMESHVYLVLAAAEIDESGLLIMDEDLGDPRLSQPGSGIYAHIHGGQHHWNSPSALGLNLPEFPDVLTGRRQFSEPSESLQYFSMQYGFGFQGDDGDVTPFTVTLLMDAEEINQQTNAFRMGLWRALGAAGLILVLAQILIVVLGFRPLRRVATDVARIESGQASLLEGAYPSELEPLVRNVNRLLKTEKSNQQRIRNALDSLAHSLKTPLAIIQSGLELPTDAARGQMRTATEDMSHLITTRLERASASARRSLAEPIELAPQLDRVIDSLNKVYSHKMIDTSCTISADLRFFGEQRDLLELMGNLLDNAYKYGDRKIAVSAAEIGSGQSRPGLWISVEDDGQGIDPSQRERLLQRGVRGDERADGHGLGLAIVTELVTAYGGQLFIEDSTLGGAKVTIKLPVS